MTSIDKQLTELLLEVYSTGEIGDLSTYIDRIKSLFSYSDTKPIEERKEAFKEQCRIELLKEDRSNAMMLTRYFNYWSEHSQPVRSNTKMRFEKEKVFDNKKRYATWVRNNKKFSVVNMINKGKVDYK